MLEGITCRESTSNTGANVFMMKPLLKKPNTPPISLQTNESAHLPEGLSWNSINIYMWGWSCQRMDCRGYFQTLAMTWEKPLKSSSPHVCARYNSVELTRLLRRLTRVWKFKPSVFLTQETLSFISRRFSVTSVIQRVWQRFYLDKSRRKGSVVIAGTHHPPAPGKFQCRAKRWNLQGKALSVHNEVPR